MGGTKIMAQRQAGRGRNNKIVGQTGEYLVAAELSRRGHIATTFTGNVPHFDIIASNEHGKHVSVQVKASRNPSWQFGDITRYCKISFKGKRQIVGSPVQCPVRGLVVVFVIVRANGADEFFILSWRVLRTILVRHHKAFLEKHHAQRPQRWESLHTAITTKVLEPYRDRWDVIEKNLK